MHFKMNKVLYNRVKWLDITKSLAIILMVLGHTSIPQIASNFIYAFHMPVFFIASGWCTSWKKYPFSTFLIKRCKTLLVPFILYSFSVIVFSCFIGETDIFTLKNGWQGYALWFVPVLFIASLVAKLIMEIKWVFGKVSAVVLFLGIGVTMSHFKVNLPWTLSTVPYATFLILLGTYLNRFETVISKPRWYILLGGFLIVTFVSHYWRLDLAWNHITPVIILTIGALAGCTMLATVSSYISSGGAWISTTLIAIGRETFVIMAFSQICIIALNKYLVLNPVMKYLLLAVILTIIVCIKNVFINAIKKR